MGRKKFYQDKEPETEQKQSLWRIGIYLRISDAENSIVESDSISNQRLLLESYVKANPEFKLVDIYIDDGLTGLNFNRPSFVRMIDDVASGLINCVIVKDLSRLGRDTIQVRQTIEEILPSYNCRFISLTELIDTFLRPDDGLKLSTHFTQFINEHYSGELSRNTRLGLDAQRAEGKVVFPVAPYGYIKDPSNIYKLKIDEEAASVVREIFQLSISGMGIIRIVLHLNALKIDAPSLYKKKKGIYKSPVKITGTWIQSTVKNILSNMAYIGHLEQKKRSKPNYRSPKMIAVPKENRIISYNTHEPIISEMDFKRVQDKYTRCVLTPPKQQRVHLFSGLLKCSDCNNSMIRTSKTINGKVYAYYKCRTFSHQSAIVCSNPHKIKHEKLVELVSNAIKAQVFSVAKLTNIVNRINLTETTQEKIKMLRTQIEKNKLKIERNYNTKKEMYKDLKRELITEDDYSGFSKDLTRDAEELKQSIGKIEKQIDYFERMKIKDIDWLTEYMQYFDYTKLTRSMLTALVEKIFITKNTGIKIVFRYADELSSIHSFINDYHGGFEDAQ